MSTIRPGNRVRIVKDQTGRDIHLGNKATVVDQWEDSYEVISDEGESILCVESELVRIKRKGE